MRSSFQNHTVSSLARSRPCRTATLLQSYEKQEKEKKVLSDMKDIKHALKALHGDASQQLKLELESQQTFEFFAEQLRVIRGSMLTLTDVFEEEFITLKHHYQTEMNNQSTELIKMDSRIRELQNENHVLKQEMEEMRSQWSSLNTIRLESITNEKVPKLEQKVKQIVAAIRQQAELISSAQDKISSHSEVLSELDLEQNIGKNSQGRIVSDLESKITKLYEKTNELIRQNSSSLKSDVSHLSQEMISVKNQVKVTSKLQNRVNQIEYELQRVMSDKNEEDTSVEAVAFNLKKLQVACEGLKDRYEFILKETRSENSALQSSVSDLGLKFSSVKQYSERVASEVTNLSKSVQKKTTSLSNAINVLVEMMDQTKNTDLNAAHSIHEASSTHNLYQ